MRFYTLQYVNCSFLVSIIALRSSLLFCHDFVDRWSNKEIFADFYLTLCNRVAVPAGCVCEYCDALVRGDPLPRPTSSQVQDRLVSSCF